MTEQTYSISEVAERTGLTAHTLRYYERAGLMLAPVGRASSAHRRYSEGDVTWIGFLTKLRATGMPIATVREYTRLAGAGGNSAAARLELLRAHRISVVAQLEEITHSLAAIDTKIAVYEERIAHE